MEVTGLAGVCRERGAKRLDITGRSVGETPQDVSRELSRGSLGGSPGVEEGQEKDNKTWGEGPPALPNYSGIPG